MAIWNQQKCYNADYRHNHVYESESENIREYDDTKGNERIYEAHRTGTSYMKYPQTAQKAT